MEKFICVTTELPEDVLNELKRVTGKETTKDALYVAIEHYLSCSFTKDGEKIRKIKNLGRVGRHPVYLKTLFERQMLETNE